MSKRTNPESVSRPLIEDLKTNSFISPSFEIGYKGESVRCYFRPNLQFELNEIALFGFKRKFNKVKKWSSDLIIELFKQGGSDFEDDEKQGERFSPDSFEY